MAGGRGGSAFVNSQTVGGAGGVFGVNDGAGSTPASGPGDGAGGGGGAAGGGAGGLGGISTDGGYTGGTGGAGAVGFASFGDYSDFQGVAQGRNGANAPDRQPVDSGYGGGGGGGEGGFGAVLNGNLTIGLHGDFRGGEGGNGASRYSGGGGGWGGDGGVGILANPGSSIANFAGSIIGGGGGGGGLGSGAGNDGTGGNGGDAIVGSDLRVLNAATIAGGTAGYNPSGNGLPSSGTPQQGNAINFTSGTNKLELWAGSAIYGNVVANGTTDTLVLGGAAPTGGFDISDIGDAAKYRGFEAFEKTGTGQWTINGTSSTVMNWIVSAGELRFSNASPAVLSTAVVKSGATVLGTGAFGGAITVESGGTLHPESLLTFNTGSLSLASGAIYWLDYNNGATRLSAAGSVSLGGATLFLPSNQSDPGPTTQTIIENDGSDAVIGTFAGLSQGSTVTLGFRYYYVRYDGGDGNDVTLSITPLTPAKPALAAISDTGTSSSDNITKAANPTFTGTAVSGFTVELYDTDGTTVLGTTTAVGGVWSITSSTLADSLHTVTVKVTDSANNSSAASATLAVTIDLTPPPAPPAPDLDTASDLGASSSDNITTMTAPKFTGTAESGATVTLYDTDGTTVLGTGIATGGNWSITSSALTLGNHTVTAKATDVAGNVSAASADLVVTIVAPPTNPPNPTTPTQPTFPTVPDPTPGDGFNEAQPGLIMTQFFTGEVPTPEKAAALAAFSQSQFDAYTKMGAANPALGPFEAIGRGSAETPGFIAKYGALSEADFITSTYASVFLHAGTTEQIAHFQAQIDYFEAIYEAAGISSQQADLFAKGAVLGQMVGHAFLGSAAATGTTSADMGWAFA
jgi:hypothetical protein